MKSVTISRNFFCYAAKMDLDIWQGLPDYVTATYCIGVVMDAERTHIASTQPSSFVMELRNEFVCNISNAENLYKWLEYEGSDYPYAALSDDYYDFIDHATAGNTVSEKIEFSDDFEVDDDFDAENDRLPDHVRDSLRDQAREYFGGNHYTPDCCDYEESTL